jgi:hypothetical protein
LASAPVRGTLPEDNVRAVLIANVMFVVVRFSVIYRDCSVLKTLPAKLNTSRIRPVEFKKAPFVSPLGGVIVAVMVVSVTAVTTNGT